MQMNTQANGQNPKTDRPRQRLPAATPVANDSSVQATAVRGPEPYTVRHSHSAGGVAYRLRTVDAQPIIEMALITTDRNGQRWQLPKGRLYPAEEPLTAAIREVKEETGLETEFVSFLQTVHYEYLDTYARTIPERVYKKVDFYLLRMVGGHMSDASVEVQAVAWALPEDALDRLTFAGERECIRLAVAHLFANP